MNIIDSRLEKLNNSTMLKKWIFNDQINHQLSNFLWKAQQTTDAQTTQIFRFRFSQHMRNHTNILFWSQSSLTGSNPNCTLSQSINKDTCPTYCPSAIIYFLKGLRIVRHNVATQQITKLLKSDTHTHNTIYLQMQAKMKDTSKIIRVCHGQQ